MILIDTIGELSAVWGLADVAFVGGTLVPRGGHNLVEPGAFGVPVLGWLWLLKAIPPEEMSNPRRGHVVSVELRLEVRHEVRPGE